MTDISVPGLLSEANKQQVRVILSVHGNQVVQHFDAPREFACMYGEEALAIGVRMMALAIEADPNCAQALINGAMALIDYAYEQRGDLKPAGGAVKHEMIERHRRKLTQRLEIMLNSLREKKRVSNAELAKQVVDTMLAEVFS